MSTTRPYRGKRTDSGEWVYGSLISDRFIVGDVLEWNEEYFNTEWWCSVDPSTVGQALGVTDRNGVLIFVGDICRDSLGWAYEVTWDADNSRYIGRHSKPRSDTYICYVNRVDKNGKSATEVIGNIYDNPGLLHA